MLKCADCGALVQDGRQACGLCGSNRLYPPGEIVQPIPSQLLHPQQPSRSVRIGAFAATVGVLTLGIILLVLPPTAYLSLVGALLVAVAGLILISAGGFSSGAFRYRGWRSGRYMRRADLERDRHEKEEMED